MRFSSARICLSEAQLVACPKSIVDEFDLAYRQFLHVAVDLGDATWSWYHDPVDKSHTFFVRGPADAVELVKQAAMAVVHHEERVS